MNTNNLDKEYFIHLGQRLGCDPAALKAVQMVESGGKGGFLPSGRPQILFEGHIFYKLLKENEGIPRANFIAKQYPTICYPSWDKKKYKGGEKEWDRLEKAKKINEFCAIQSASWGMFQIMGMNFRRCGCITPFEFVEKMSESQQAQFELAVVFFQKSGCLSLLRARNWASFAKKYNGPGYAQNKYDTKLAAAYEKAKKDGYHA